MIIANPIYDTVFKRLMENERVAKFFIGTLLEEIVESVEVKPQEFTFFDQLARLSVFKLDFIATIKTENGTFKKVLIEIQKARNHMDLMRFRNYLAEQYKKKDKIGDEEIALPITTIYILGFKLPEVDTACLRVKRDYVDLVNQNNIIQKSEFVEKLTHDCFIVQVQRITDRYQTKLDKLLSIFEQNNFIDEKKTIKEYKHIVDDEAVKISTDILHHSGTNPEERKLIEDEQEAWRTVNAAFEDKEKDYLRKIENFNKELEKKEKDLEEKDKVLEEKDKVLEEKDKVLEEKDKVLEEKDKLIEELLKKLNQTI
jgi:hypothetical protein